VSWGTFLIFEKFPVVTLGMPVGPPLHFTKIFQNMFLSVETTVLMREMVFDNFQKVSEGLE
jgi:hypothetical protein